MYYLDYYLQIKITITDLISFYIFLKGVNACRYPTSLLSNQMKQKKERSTGSFQTI